MTKKQARTLMALGVGIILTQILCTAILLRGQERNFQERNYRERNFQAVNNTHALAPVARVTSTLDRWRRAGDAPRRSQFQRHGAVLFIGNQIDR